MGSGFLPGLVSGPVWRHCGATLRLSSAPFGSRAGLAPWLSENDFYLGPVTQDDNYFLHFLSLFAAKSFQTMA
jgi:hypothetical protein